MRASFTTLAIFASLSVALAGSGGSHTISVVNNCPSDISLFKSGIPQGYLAQHASKDFTVPPDWSGLIYSSANGGSQSGSFTTKAGFYFPNNNYYIVRDEQHFNTGIEIVPVRAQYSGDCSKATCTTPDCGSNAFTSMPTGFMGKPTAPLFQCSKNGWDYLVTFCPDGTFPPAIHRKAVVHHPAGRVDPGSPIHPSWNKQNCMAVEGEFPNGSSVVIEKCTGASSQLWVYTQGTTQLRLAGTNFCVDHGSGPNQTANIWWCSDDDNLKWIVTNNNRIQAAADVKQCLTNSNYGSMVSGNPVVSAPCIPNNSNQVWT